MIPLIVLLVFVAVVTPIAGVWMALDARRGVRARLAGIAAPAPVRDVLAEAPPVRPWRTLLDGVAPARRLEALARQAGRTRSGTEYLVAVVALSLVAFIAVSARSGSLALGLAGAVLGGALPPVQLLWGRQRRLARFGQQFPDALDTMTRSLRAGYAMTGAIGNVADDVPDPVGGEFRRVVEEIRMGLDPGEALGRLAERVPSDDVRFFCTAIRIQRSAGGNLAEILERLCEVIRERFKLLSHARALAAQHKWSGVCVGLSPLAFALVFAVLQPGYFEPLWKSSLRNLLLGGGMALEIVGFAAIMKIARIKV
jgi:tight adherence protein B